LPIDLGTPVLGLPEYPEFFTSLLERKALIKLRES
jgi:hypothetical protein